MLPVLSLENMVCDGVSSSSAFHDFAHCIQTEESTADVVEYTEGLTDAFSVEQRLCEMQFSVSGTGWRWPRVKLSPEWA